MKFVAEEIAGMGHKRYMFSLGKFEASILRGLLVSAIKHTPDTPHTSLTMKRMRAMKNVIGEAIPQMKNPNDGYPSVPKMPPQIDE